MPPSSRLRSATQSSGCIRRRGPSRFGDLGCGCRPPFGRMCRCADPITSRRCKPAADGTCPVGDDGGNPGNRPTSVGKARMDVVSVQAFGLAADDISDTRPGFGLRQSVLPHHRFSADSSATSRADSSPLLPTSVDMRGDGGSESSRLREPAGDGPERDLEDLFERKPKGGSGAVVRQRTSGQRIRQLSNAMRRPIGKTLRGNAKRRSAEVARWQGSW